MNSNSESKEPEWLEKIIEEVCAEKGIPVVLFRRLLAKVEEHGERAQAWDLAEEILEILKEGEGMRDA